MTTAPDDYIARLIAKTARRDADLRRCGPIGCAADASAGLLRALQERWPLDSFDELNIALDARENRRLHRALVQVIGPAQPRKLYGYRRLDKAAEERIERWLIAIAGRDFGGLRLRRNAIGWCRIEPAEGYRQ